MFRTKPFAARLLAGALALGLALPVAAVSTTYRVQPPAAKAAFHDALKAQAGAIPATSLSVATVRGEEIQAVREENSLAFGKSLTIGIGRDVADTPDAGSASLRWTLVPGGAVAHWRVTSSGAEAMRVGLEVARLAPGVELRFSGNGSSVVYGPFTGTEAALPQGEVYWSPVLEGDVATVEVFSPDAAAPSLSAGVRVVRVSHLFVSPSNPRAESLAKDSGACQVDLVCLSASDAALANAGKATARMTATGSSGRSGLCTGTLINSIATTAQPYFFTANHCFNPSGRASQASASSVTTLWFRERSACGGGSVSEVQVGGGARLLYADAPSDVMLLRLNSPPPPGAIFSGWDAGVVPLGTRFWAVHHPSGDVKKVSLGSMGGYVADLNGSAGNILMNVLWDGTATGVTEPGSSGSAVFSRATGSSGTEYRLRGGLYGGPSSCSATGTALRDYYSRLDTNYAYLDQYLNPGSSCSHTVSSSSISAAGEGGSASVSVSTTASCGWSAASEVDWITTSSAAIGSGTAQLTISANTSGATRTGTVNVGKQTVTVTQPAATASGTELLTNPGFESGATGWVQIPANIITNAPPQGITARSGAGLAWLSGVNNANDLLYQQVTIPADATTAVLSFWYRISTEDLPVGDFDNMVVSIDNASGTPVGSVVTLSNRNGPSGWTQSAVYDLSMFRGQTIRIAFRATSDSSLITSFFVDDVSVAITRSSSAFQATGLWYNFPAESEAGWGINFTQQGDIVFGTLFTYDTDGSPLWLVMSAGRRQGTADTFAGELYRTTGPAFNSVPFNPAQVGVTQVGTMTVAFQSNGTAQLNYTVNGAPVSKTIVRQQFGSRVANCSNTTGSRAALTHYQDLWYAAPAESESGWGINFTQQTRGAEQIIFATLFTYDASGRGLWLVMSEGIRQSDGSFLGQLFRTRGPAFNAVPFTPIGPGDLTPVGTMRLAFSNGETGTLSYSVNGVQVNKNITRQVFSSPLPACN